MRDLVFVDVETTGLDPDRHELLEVAAIRVDGVHLEPVTRFFTARIRPSAPGIAGADLRALEVNGYTAELWADAISLEEAMQQLAPVLEGAMVAGHNVRFDWAFLSRALAQCRLPVPETYHLLLDTASLAWLLVTTGRTQSLSLDAACTALGISRPSPHRALDDAAASLRVAREIRRCWSYLWSLALDGERA